MSASGDRQRSARRGRARHRARRRTREHPVAAADARRRSPGRRGPVHVDRAGQLRRASRSPGRRQRLAEQLAAVRSRTSRRGAGVSCAAVAEAVRCRPGPPRVSGRRRPAVDAASCWSMRSTRNERSAAVGHDRRRPMQPDRGEQRATATSASRSASASASRPRAAAARSRRRAPCGSAAGRAGRACGAGRRCTSRRCSRRRRSRTATRGRGSAPSTAPGGRSCSR